MGTSEKAAAKRLGRGIFGLILSGITFLVTKNPASIAFAPIVNALGKWLRARR